MSIRRAYDGKGPIEYFLPTCFMRVNQFGTMKTVTRKMLFSYIFIKDTEPGIRDIKRSIPQLRLLTMPGSKRGDTRYMIISDRDMDMFRKIADAYSGQLPCYRVGDIQLEEGDYVRVVGGMFDGIEGRMISSPGRNSGQVILPVSNLFLVSTGDIAQQYIQILEFGKGNRHPYNMFEAHLPRAVDALANKLTKGELTEKELASMLVFTGRLEQLQPATLIIESFHSGLMLMSYTAMGRGHEEAAAQWLNRCHELLPKLTAEIQLSLQLSMMYAATGDSELHKRLQIIVDEWQPIKANQKKKRTIAEMLARFEGIYNEQR